MTALMLRAFFYGYRGVVKPAIPVQEMTTCHSKHLHTIRSVFTQNAEP